MLLHTILNHVIYSIGSAAINYNIHVHCVRSSDKPPPTLKNAILQLKAYQNGNNICMVCYNHTRLQLFVHAFFGGND